MKNQAGSPQVVLRSGRPPSAAVSIGQSRGFAAFCESLSHARKSLAAPFQMNYFLFMPMQRIADLRP
ncbi:hypothetical protein SAMN05446934_4916 [Paraburkholderia hospita]|nr:hypothetical protein SAMN05446934_4916 [Paraburkholderia hospita]